MKVLHNRSRKTEDGDEEIVTLLSYTLILYAEF